MELQGVAGWAGLGAPGRRWLGWPGELAGDDFFKEFAFFEGPLT